MELLVCKTIQSIMFNVSTYVVTSLNHISGKDETWVNFERRKLR